MELRGESIGDYVKRLEQFLPPESFTGPEWYIGQVYCYLLHPTDAVRGGDDEARKKWIDLVIAYEDRFPDAIKKFKIYMGWEKAEETKLEAPSDGPTMQTINDQQVDIAEQMNHDDFFYNR